VLGFQPIVNGEGSSSSGLETALRVGFSDDDSLFGTWTWQSVHSRDSGLAIPGIPGQMLNLGATFRLRTRYVLTPTLVVRGSRPRAHLDTRSEVPGFAQVDLVMRAERVFRTLDLSLILRNVFDVKGHDPSPLRGVPGDYPRPGRNGLFQASYRF
jgi:outer membrane receptor protein involved in Fe transport